jgi:tryptophan-rich sensory protein
MNTSNWYEELIKPSWAPPNWLFGNVWSVLYILIFISFSGVFYQWMNGKLSWMVVLPFVLNIFFNIAFSPIQFGLRNNLLAAIDITLILATIIWAMIAIWPYMKWVALMQIPYLVWVCIATTLQFSITYLNWK